MVGVQTPERTKGMQIANYVYLSSPLLSEDLEANLDLQLTNFICLLIMFLYSFIAAAKYCVI